MYSLISWGRGLRRILLIKASIRSVIVLLMVVGAWVATQPLEFPKGLNLNDKLIHAFVFLSFAFLMDIATSRRPFWLWKGVPLLGYGIGIEILQYFSPDRSFSFLDMLADACGIFLYFICKLVLLRVLEN